MIVRVDFAGVNRPRTIRASSRSAAGIMLIAEPGPRLPFRDSSVDELFLGRTVMLRGDIAETLDECWRVSKPGALVHLTLPHASSTVAVSRDARPRPLLTLNTFNAYDHRFKSPDDPSPAIFTVERARLRLAGRRDGDVGLALARGPFARFIEKLANGSRGSQYRFERWFAQWFGGFEEFDVVLGVMKPLDGHRRDAHRAGDLARRETESVAQ